MITYAIGVRKVLRNSFAATVQTFLRRLEKKGYIQARRQGRTKYYRPRAQPRRVIRETIDDLLQLLFDGQALPLVRHLIHERRITDEELRELRETLGRLEGEDDGPCRP